MGPAGFMKPVDRERDNLAALGASHANRMEDRVVSSRKCGTNVCHQTMIIDASAF
jgi:hypothetical protein